MGIIETIIFGFILSGSLRLSCFIPPTYVVISRWNPLQTEDCLCWHRFFWSQQSMLCLSAASKHPRSLHHKNYWFPKLVMINGSCMKSRKSKQYGWLRLLTWHSRTQHKYHNWVAFTFDWQFDSIQLPQSTKNNFGGFLHDIFPIINQVIISMILNTNRIRKAVYSIIHLLIHSLLIYSFIHCFHINVVTDTHFIGRCFLSHYLVVLTRIFLYTMTLRHVLFMLAF